MTTLATMTLVQLKQVIRQEVKEMLSEDEYLKRLFGEFEINEAEFFSLEPRGDWSWRQVNAFIDEHRWTPSPDAKSSIELLREDRDAK